MDYISPTSPIKLEGICQKKTTKNFNHVTDVAHVAIYFEAVKLS